MTDICVTTLQLAIRAVGFQFHFTQDSGTEEGEAIYLILYLGKKGLIFLHDLWLMKGKKNKCL